MHAADTACQGCENRGRHLSVAAHTVRLRAAQGSVTQRGATRRSAEGRSSGVGQLNTAPWNMSA